MSVTDERLLGQECTTESVTSRLAGPLRGLPAVRVVCGAHGAYACAAFRLLRWGAHAFEVVVGSSRRPLVLAVA